MRAETVDAGASEQSRDRDDATPSFDDFVLARSRTLWRSAWLLTGDAQRAEDLVQTALVKVWRHWSRVSRGGAIDAYARRALVTTYTDWWRRKWTGEMPTETLADSAKPAWGAQAADPELLETRRDLVAALSRLSRGQRAVVVLRYFEDLTEAETAEALGCSVGTVKSQHARAIGTLRSSPLLARLGAKTEEVASTDMSGGAEDTP